MKSQIKYVLIGLGAFTAALVGSMQLISSSARADDANRTTSFAVRSIDYGLGAGSQSAYVASCSDSSPSDARVTIELFSTNPYESEDKDLETLAQRSLTKGLWAEITAPVDQRLSGTQFRAHFVAYDDSGNVTFTYDRTLALP